jgi:hypothetical protein
MAVEEFKTTYTLTNEQRNHLQILINENQSAVDSVNRPGFIGDKFT